MSFTYAFTHHHTSFQGGPWTVDELTLQVFFNGKLLLAFTPNNPELLVNHLKAYPRADAYESSPPNGTFSFGVSDGLVVWEVGHFMHDESGTSTVRTPVDASFYQMLAAIGSLA